MNLGTLGAKPAGTTTVTDSKPDAATVAKVDRDKLAESMDADGNDKVIPAANTDPTAEEVGLDVEKVQHDDVIGAELAANRAANAGYDPENAGDVVVYSSHPWQQHYIGEYHFVDSLLRLAPDKAAEFDKLLESLPATERINIRKLDVSRVQDIIASRQAIAGVADSSAGRSAMLNLQAANKVVGTEALESLSEPKIGFDSADGNNPVLVETDPDKAIDVAE